MWTDSTGSARTSGQSLVGFCDRVPRQSLSSGHRTRTWSHLETPLWQSVNGPFSRCPFVSAFIGRVGQIDKRFQRCCIRPKRQGAPNRCFRGFHQAALEPWTGEGDCLVALGGGCQGMPAFRARELRPPDIHRVRQRGIISVHAGTRRASVRVEWNDAFPPDPCPGAGKLDSCWPESLMRKPVGRKAKREPRGGTKRWPFAPPSQSASGGSTPRPLQLSPWVSRSGSRAIRRRVMDSFRLGRGWDCHGRPATLVATVLLFKLDSLLPRKYILRVFSSQGRAQLFLLLLHPTLSCFFFFTSLVCDDSVKLPILSVDQSTLHKQAPQSCLAAALSRPRPMSTASRLP